MRIQAGGVPGFRGITLVELLLTLAALMILASVVWKAGTTVIDRCNNSRVTAEIGALDRALVEFATQFGDYPPDFHDTVAVWKFLKKRFPKCPQEKYPDMCGYNPASALYFWLAGPDGRGFSTNPANPFGNGDRADRAILQIRAGAVEGVDGLMQYYPPRGIDGSPYIYFRGGSERL